MPGQRTRSGRRCMFVHSAVAEADVADDADDINLDDPEPSA